jgi:two-component system phosphate regulon sensor histidine kinase PhoR
VLAIVSHDLRNPLTAILLAINGVERDMPVPHAEPLEWLIDIARPAVSQMQRLIRDLLDMANIEAGRLALKRAPADVALLLERARDAVAARFDEAGIHCDYEVANGLPLAHVDSERIHQVLGNLLSNALNVVSPGGAVSMGARRERDTIVISVHDTGPGIAAGDLPHLFEPFWRAQSAKAEGTGLGLSIARVIVEGHGGRIWADETQSEGATLMFSVPVVWTDRVAR